MRAEADKKPRRTLRIRRILTVLVALTLSSGCGGGETDDGETPTPGTDAGAASDVDAGTPQLDTSSSGTELGVADSGGEDTESDVVDTGGPADVDAGGCEVSGPNTEIDRDRDGLRDDCDHLPYLNHGGDNPKEPTVLEEDESKVENDNARDGEDYDLEMPLYIEGGVGPVEQEGDLDYYSFEVDAPTVLLVRVDARTDQFWPGAVVLGYEGRNANVQKILFGESRGTDAEREFFLPVPGKYSIALTDVRNLLPDSQNPDVGGDGNFQYRARISEVPLPSIESSSVPSAFSHVYDHRVHAYEVDASALSGLEVRAVGTGRSQNAFHNPLVALYDPDADRAISYTISQQVDPSTRRVELATNLSNVDDRLLVIEDHGSQFGESSAKLEFVETTVESEFETVGEPQDERVDRLVWMQPGDSVDATIGPPRTASPTSLSPDVDHYLLTAVPGTALEVVVEPTAGSELQPDIALGNYIARPSGGSRFYDVRGHAVPGAESPGATRRVRFFYNDRTAGEIGIRVRHAPNNSGDNVEGGAGFGYRLKVRRWEPSPVALGQLPATGTAVIEPGDLGLFSFTPQNKSLIRVRPVEPDGISFFERGRLTRVRDWHAVGQDNGTIEFLAEAGSEYWYDIRDYNGGGTEGKEMAVEVDRIQVDSLPSLPATVSGQLASEGASDYYRLQVSAGDRIDLRAHAPDMFARIDVLDGSTLDRVEVGYDSAVFQAERSGDYLVKISAAGSDTGGYTLGVQRVQPDALGMAPASTSGTVDNQPFPKWYAVSVDKGSAYEVVLDETGSGDFDGRVDVYRADGMNRLERSTGTLRFPSDFAGEVYIAVYDDDQRGDPGYTFDLSVEELRVESLSTGQQTNDQLASGDAAVLYEFSANPGAVDISVQSQGSWTPVVRLLEGSDLDTIDDAEFRAGALRYASSRSRSYALLVRSSDRSLSGPLKFTVDGQIHSTSPSVNEQEPNDSVADAQSVSSLPATVGGTLGVSGDSTDMYALDLQAGERVWALSMPVDSGLRYQFRTELRLVNGAGNELASDRFDGDGSMPALYGTQVPQDGSYVVSFEQRRSQSGDYRLYLFIQ